MCSVLILSVTDYSWNCKPFAGQIKSILQIKHSPQHGNHPVATYDLAYYSKSLPHLVKLQYCEMMSSREEEVEKQEVESHTIRKSLKIHCAFRDSINGTTMTSVGTVEPFRQGIVCSVLWHFSYLKWVTHLISSICFWNLKSKCSFQITPELKFNPVYRCLGFFVLFCF